MSREKAEADTEARAKATTPMLVNDGNYGNCGVCLRSVDQVGWALRIPPMSQLAWLGYRLVARWRHHLPFSTNTGGRCDQGTR